MYQPAGGLGTMFVFQLPVAIGKANRLNYRLAFDRKAMGGIEGQLRTMPLSREGTRYLPIRDEAHVRAARMEHLSYRYS